MSELLVDFITSLDGYGAAEGWPGWWGVEGPEYLRWLDEQPERDYTVLMGANTYQLMSGFAAQFESESDESEEAGSLEELTAASKVVFSSTLQTPLSWANTRLVKGNAVVAVADMKRYGVSMRTIGSLALCRSLLEAGLVDRFRVVVFPVITGAPASTGSTTAIPTSPWKWLPAVRSTAGSNCSSTGQRCSMVRPARPPVPDPEWRDRVRRGQ